MAGKGGGSWKVAYADFVTAMMAFFMVMWLVGQKPEVKAAIAGYFDDPYADSKHRVGAMDLPPKPTKQRGKGDVAPHKMTPSEDPEDPDNRNPRLLALHGGDITAVGAVAFFAGSGVDLDESARGQLDRIVPKLIGMPQKIEVRGHASSGPAQGEDGRDGWTLSYERCVAVMNYLKAQGIEPDRLRLSQAGVYEPLTIGGQDRAQARNSRVEVLLLAELAEDLVGTAGERASRFEEPGETSHEEESHGTDAHGHAPGGHDDHGHAVSTGHGHDDGHGHAPAAKDHGHAH